MRGVTSIFRRRRWQELKYRPGLRRDVGERKSKSFVAKGVEGPCAEVGTCLRPRFSQLKRMAGAEKFVSSEPIPSGLPPEGTEPECTTFSTLVSATDASKEGEWLLNKRKVTGGAEIQRVTAGWQCRSQWIHAKRGVSGLALEKGAALLVPKH